MLAALLFALLGRTTHSRIHADFAHSGRVTIDARLSAPATRVVVHDAKRRVLYDATFPVGDFDHDLRGVHARAFHVDGLASPIVLIVVDGPAADGVWIAMLLIGELPDGRVVQLFDPGIARGEDGMCIEPWGIVAGTGHVGLLSVMEKHPYDLRRWIVRDGKLVRGSHTRTRGRYMDFSSAVGELGLHCMDRVGQLMLQ